MITILSGEHLSSYPRGCAIVDSSACPGEPCCGDKGGRCVVQYDIKTETIKCHASFPPGFSWTDCVCTQPNCEHHKEMEARMLAQRPPTDPRGAARLKAKTVAEANQHKLQEDDHGR